MIYLSPDDKFLYDPKKSELYAEVNKRAGCVPVTLMLGNTPVKQAWKPAAEMARALGLPLVLRYAPPAIDVVMHAEWRRHTDFMRDVCAEFSIATAHRLVAAVLGNQESHDWRGSLLRDARQMTYVARANELHAVFAEAFGGPLQIWYRFGDQQSYHWSTHSSIAAAYPMECHRVLSARCYEIAANNKADFDRVRNDNRYYISGDYSYAAWLSNPCGNGYVNGSWAAGDDDHFGGQAEADGEWVREQIEAGLLNHVCTWLHPARAPQCWERFLKALGGVA